MRGRIKIYDSNKGFGLIVGEDNHDYFFHISKMKSIEQPYEGSIVNFLPKQGDKALVAEAEKVVIQKQSQRPDIIKIGNTRIKLNNIKNYGISVQDRYYLKVYKSQKRKGILNQFLDISDYIHNGMKTEISYATANDLLRGKTVEKQVFLNKGQFHYTNRTVNGSNLEYAKYDGLHSIDSSESDESDKSDLIHIKEKYLYLTTYQKDKYTFYNSEIDIEEKLNELDKYLS
jgi:cold shock CspA family protein